MADDESSPERDVHRVLDPTNPDPTEWPDPCDKHRDPRDPDGDADEMDLGEVHTRPAPPARASRTTRSIRRSTGARRTHTSHHPATPGWSLSGVETAALTVADLVRRAVEVGDPRTAKRTWVASRSSSTITTSRSRPSRISRSDTRSRLRAPTTRSRTQWSRSRPAWCCTSRPSGAAKTRSATPMS